MAISHCWGHRGIVDMPLLRVAFVSIHCDPCSNHHQHLASTPHNNNAVPHFERQLPVFLRYKASLRAARLTDSHIGACLGSVSFPVCVDAQECSCIAIGGCANCAERFIEGNPLRRPTTAAYYSTLLGFIASSLHVPSSTSHNQTSLRNMPFSTVKSHRVEKSNKITSRKKLDIGRPSSLPPLSSLEMDYLKQKKPTLSGNMPLVISPLLVAVGFHRYRIRQGQLAQP